MNFASDNVYGVHPRILQAIIDANQRLTEVPYGHDDGAKACGQALTEVFEKDVQAFLVLNGSMANSLALSAMTPPFGGIFCHEAAHIQTDECNGPELFTGGAKLLALPGEGNKITPQTVEARLRHFVHGEHGARPSVVSITQATELGTVYSVDEIAALGATARTHGFKLHMDGARFANALVSLGCTPAEMTWKSGVDALSFGGTKNGAMILEAVVFFEPTLAEHFLYRRKRAGQLLSKGRYLSAQLLAYLQDDLWLDNARRANALAQQLGAGLSTVPSVWLAQPVQANEVFAVMPTALFDALQAQGATFYEWPVDGLDDGLTHARFVTSWATPPQDIERFLTQVQALAVAMARLSACATASHPPADPHPSRP